MDRKRQVVEELHRPARRNYTRRHVEMRGIDDTWQADLVDLQAYADVNDGFKYMLTIIDVFSKYAWAVPLKTKSAKDVINAMEGVLKNGRTPEKLQVDQGTEFHNRHFKTLMKRHRITMYSTSSNLKASICERFNRTLKEQMWKRFSLQGTYKWIDIIDTLMVEYNNRRHRTIKMAPIHVTADNETYLLRHIYGKFEENRTRTIKFDAGDHVRISHVKHMMEKGYTPNWTTEIFTITEVVNTNPITYKLKDYQNKPIDGSFYQEELTSVRDPDVYLVEKVLQRRRDKVLVKWLGFDHSHNTWIDKNEL